MQIFDWLKELTVNKSKWESFTEEEQATFTPYMVHRFLSMNPEYIEFVNLVQTFPYSDKKKIYDIYLYMIPKKNMFLKYIKSTKKKKQESLLKHIANYYECSLGEAEEYIDILRESGVKSILTKLGVEEKEQKKLLKNG
jgi:heterodisulfide reductase subunit B